MHPVLTARGESLAAFQRHDRARRGRRERLIAG